MNDDETTPLFQHRNNHHHHTNSTSNPNTHTGAAPYSSQRTDDDLTTFAPGDPTNPRNWSERRKWTTITPILLVDLAVSWGASGYSPAMASFMHDTNSTTTIGTLGLSLYVLGLALGPMSLAPLSEYYGRTPLYVIPFGVYVVMLMATGVARGVPVFMALRFLSGLFSGVTIANLGGTIADLWPRHRVGVPVSLWIWAAVGGSPSGFFLMSLVADTRGWRDVFVVLAAVCGLFWLLMAVVLLNGNETRHSVLLRRRAERSDMVSDGDVPDEIKPKDVRGLFKVTLSRPFRLLSTEIIVILAALYNGYLYGLSFLFNGAYGLVFGPKGYGFTTLQVGLCFLGFFGGVCVGPVTYYVYQEKYYLRQINAVGRRKDHGVVTADDSENNNNNNDTPGPTTLNDNETDTSHANLPESRLQLGKIASITLPISLWLFAWTCPTQFHIHWIAPILATTLFGWSFYTLILTTYLYIEDSYMVFSASALAGVGLVRNLAGAGFPLFGRQLFENLGYQWAGTVLAVLSMLLVPIPYVWERYGLQLRWRSPWARGAMDPVQVDEIGGKGRVV